MVLALNGEVIMSFVEYAYVFGIALTAVLWGFFLYSLIKER